MTDRVQEALARIDGFCDTCGGEGWYASADPNEFGEPGEPYQVQCLDSIHAAAGDVRAALADASVTPGLEERVAEAIYDAMRENDPEGRERPWVPGGNATKQDEARRRARGDGTYKP